jgi:hypothetical protein
MATFDRSLDPCVDLFFSIAASRGKDVSGAFARAYASDPNVAMKILFWARDARSGAGERATFRKLLQNLEITQTDSLLKNLALIPEYGRWDDLMVFNTQKVKMAAYDIVVRALRAGNGLAAKWCPRKGVVANELRKYLNFTPKAYRQLLVSLTKVVEQQMCAKEWSDINYSHVPSVASSRYMKAFTKHDSVRYTAWKEGLKSGVTKVNASVLYPYDVIKSISHGDRDVGLAQWEALPNYLGQDKILPMVDVSGSMTSPVGGQKGVGLTCMDVAISLGLYIADKQQGAFKDCWLTFTRDSRIDVLKGNLLDKMNQFRRNVGYDTNIESAFRSILQLATQNNLDPEEMPKYILVLSDMEFNDGNVDGKSVGAFELARQMFEAAGYKLPKLVWWNLNARPDATGNCPVRFDQNGTALVSGFSPSIMKSILSAENFTPRDIMLETISSERYQAVKA